jgi:hypothetical protein
MKHCSYCGHDNEDAASTCAGCGESLDSTQSSTESEPGLADPALAPVVVATFTSLQEASLLVDRLEAAGIEAVIPEEYAEQVFSAVIPLASITVRVAAKDYEAARAVLAEPAG